MGWINVNRFEDDGVSFTFNVVGSTGKVLVDGLEVKDEEVTWSRVHDGDGHPVTAKFGVKDGKCKLHFNDDAWQRIKKIHEPMVEDFVRAMGSSDGGFMD